MPPSTQDDATLLNEARVLGRYLVGKPVPEAIQQRYADAHRKLLPQPADSLTLFARQRPWSVPFLDAAAALQGAHPDFRKRVLLMATILEATPLYASEFLPTPRSFVGAGLTIAWSGFIAVARAVIGMPIYLAVRNRAS